MCIVVGVVMALAGACGDDDEFDGESRGLPSARASRAASRPASGGPRDMGPPDTGPMDMGPDVRDLGPMDMGADVRDVGPVDLGPFDGGPAVCDSNADYMADELCETTSCGGVGYCRSVPNMCTGGMPGQVCGCNGMTYADDRARRCARVGLRYEGACGTGSCTMSPRAACCFDDADCAIGSRCYVQNSEPMCTAMAEGVCKPTPPAGNCWGDRDCGFTMGGLACTGEQICACGNACLVADQIGSCGP